MASMHEADGLDFRLLFESSPDVLLVQRPDAPKYTMVGATEARLQATHTTREATLGHGLFEMFPDNPDDKEATGTNNLRASLDRVLATRTADTMAVQNTTFAGPTGTSTPNSGARRTSRFCRRRARFCTFCIASKT
jgi:hypothetical protein